MFSWGNRKGGMKLNFFLRRHYPDQVQRVFSQPAKRDTPKVLSKI